MLKLSQSTAGREEYAGSTTLSVETRLFGKREIAEGCETAGQLLVMETRPGGVCRRGDSEKAAIRKEMVGCALVAPSLVAIMPSGGTPR